VRSRNLVIGAILVIVAIGGLAYSMPIVTNAISLKSNAEPAALGKAPIPTLPNNDLAILAIEIASIPALIAGIFLMAVGESKVSKVDNNPTEHR
jgi:Na+/pantothenate symporter